MLIALPVLRNRGDLAIGVPEVTVRQSLPTFNRPSRHWPNAARSSAGGGIRSKTGNGHKPKASSRSR